VSPCFPLPWTTDGPEREPFPPSVTGASFCSLASSVTILPYFAIFRTLFRLFFFFFCESKGSSVEEPGQGSDFPFPLVALYEDDFLFLFPYERNGLHDGDCAET